MNVATAADRDRIAARWTDEAMAVVALCAAWCDTCTEFREAFERIAGRTARRAFRLARHRGRCAAVRRDRRGEFSDARHLPRRVSLPQEGMAARLVDAMAERSEALDEAPEAVLELPRALR